jgi:hypothetical protein
VTATAEAAPDVSIVVNDAGVGLSSAARLLEDPRCRLTLAEVARVAMALEALPVTDSARFELAAILKRADLRGRARRHAAAIPHYRASNA